MSIATPTSLPISSRAPDWDSISATIRCPLCEYDLRGLSNPRCPECGRGFDWADLLDPTKRRHAYLFEHHPERNTWSFIRTFAGGVRPWRFWRTLQPQQPAAMRRLLLYWLITLLGPVLMLAPWYMQNCIETVSMNQAQRAAFNRWYATATPGDRVRFGADPVSVQQLMERSYPLWNSGQLYRNCLLQMIRDHQAQRAIVLGAAWVLWPWTSAAMFLVLRASMRSARLRIGHVLRVMLYSFDVALWAGLAIAMCFGLAQLLEHIGSSVFWLSDVLESLDLVFLTMLAIAAIRIFFACRLYLRLPHASAVAAMSQVMSFVLVTACLAYMPGFSEPILDIMNDVARFFGRW